MRTADANKELKRGAKWVLGSNALIFPAQYLTAIVLGRLGPERLGVYQIFRLLARIAPTCTMFGGQRVLMTFLPKMTIPEERENFIKSYAFLFASLTVVLIGVLVTFPGILSRIVLGRGSLIYIVLVCIFVVLVCIKEFTGITLFSLMKYREAILTRRMPLLSITLIFCSFYIFKRDYFLLNYYSIILASFITVGVIGTIIGMQSLGTIAFQIPKKIVLPQGFWRIGLILFLISGLGLVKGDIDRYIVWARLDLEDLGYYGACVTIFLALRYFPQSMGSVFLVNFSKMIGSRQYSELREVYRGAFRKLILLVSLASLFVSSYSPHILLLYGKKYTFYAPVLMLLSLRAIIVVPSLLNSPLIVSGERVGFRLAYDASEVIIRAALILVLARRFGLIGVAAGRLISGAIMESVSIFYVKRIFQIMFPLEFLAYVIIQSANCSAMILLPHSILVSTTVFILSLALLLITKATKLTEIRELLSVLRIKPCWVNGRKIC